VDAQPAMPSNRAVVAMARIKFCQLLIGFAKEIS